MNSQTVLGGLSGLLGGIGQGIGQFQNTQLDKQKLLLQQRAQALDEARQKRDALQDFERTLQPEQDYTPEDVAPVIAGGQGHLFVRSPRDPSKLTLRQSKDDIIKRQLRDKIQEQLADPNAPKEVQSKLMYMLAGLQPIQSNQDLAAEAMATKGPELAIAAGNNATSRANAVLGSQTDMRNTDVNAASRKYDADRQLEGQIGSARLRTSPDEFKPADYKSFQEWFNGRLTGGDKKFQDGYAAAMQSGRASEYQQDALRQFKALLGSK